MITAIATLLILLSPDAPASIVLRSTVRLDRDRPVTLADVAVLSGDASKLSETVIAKSIEALPKAAGSPQWRELSRDRVQDAVGSLAPRVQGAAVSLRIAEPGGTSTANVRSAAAERIRALLGVEPDRIQITFDHSDARLLDTPTAGRRIELTPTATGERITLAVTLTEGEKLVVSGLIRALVQVKREVLVARSNLPRSEAISGDDVATEERWVSPALKPAPTEVVVGALPRSRIALGAAIESDDVQPPIVIKKGDRVWVHVSVGGATIKRFSRALQDGRTGEVIPFEPADESAKRRETRDPRTGRLRTITIKPTPYSARVAGAGLAISASEDPTP